ncbi:glycosyltransferase family 2 protein [Christiangramia marina]|uniref:glycosyltransferase family 2 protein n=1 Tax=Christiangramia marina TaxID=409436 RepID=UPI003AA85E78
MNSTPLISIIVPCYEQGKFLEKALQSIQNQTYTHWECLIIDDGSADNTEKIAKNWTEKDSRFKYYFKSNGGLSTARNLGLENAIGSYIQFLDADDYLEITKLEDSLSLVQETNSTKPLIIISNFRMFTTNTLKTSAAYCKLTPELFTLDNILYHWDRKFSIPIHCGLFSKRLFLNFRFPESLKAKEDWVMWVKFFKQGSNVLFIDKPLALYRKNHESITMTMNLYLDHIKAYKYLKQFLSIEEYELLASSLIKQQYEKSTHYKKQLLLLQNKKYVGFGRFIRRIFSKFGLGKWAIKYLP